MNWLNIKENLKFYSFLLGIPAVGLLLGLFYSLVLKTDGNVFLFTMLFILFGFLTSEAPAKEIVVKNEVK